MSEHVPDHRNLQFWISTFYKRAHNALYVLSVYDDNIENSQLTIEPADSHGLEEADKEDGDRGAAGVQHRHYVLTAL